MASSLPSKLPPAHFIPGKKQIYLPDFLVTFIQTPYLPPTTAKFRVPLSMNKLDLRDYLYHGYGVRVFNIRSYIKQRPIERQKPGTSWVEYFRRQGVKTMTVDLAEPFVWPENPKSWEDWDKETFDAAMAWRDSNAKATNKNADWFKGAEANPKLKLDRVNLKSEAEKLLSGKIKWEPTWQTLGKKYE